MVKVSRLSDLIIMFSNQPLHTIFEFAFDDIEKQQQKHAIFTEQSDYKILKFAYEYILKCYTD